ncbi:MAG: quinol:cytochrome C oxidoreductase [Pirellulales bacterium]|nr:quinol:cytochrome C oxidoreductase [Pirellulales bacterium]
MNATTARQIKTSPNLRVTNLGLRPSTIIAMGLAALVIAYLVGAFTSIGVSRFLHAYLLSLCFFLSINLGALFFVVLQHLTRARWSVVIRRIAELLTSTIPILGLLMLPVVVAMVLGDSELYSWNDAELRQTDVLIKGKAAYLNAPFFALRCLFYFATWTAIARFYFTKSVAQDHAADFRPTAQMRKWSGPAMITFAATVNFAAFDWLMSLDPHWFSTIFGIYFFAGAVVAVLAALTLVSALLQRFGYLDRAITIEHYHDLGKLLFGFMFFWAYIAFSQFLLIWYANIPEETVWYLHRQQHGWQYVGILLIAGLFLLPFFGLMSRSARRNQSVLVFWSVFLLAMHWVDLYWLAIPTVSPERVSVGAMELLTLLGIGAIWAGAFAGKLEGTALVPTGDPNLGESLAFHNV